MTSANNQRLKDLTEKLRAAGEDKAELDFWVKIFDVLPADNQKELLKNLQNELDQLNN